MAALLLGKELLNCPQSALGAVLNRSHLRGCDNRRPFILGERGHRRQFAVGDGLQGSTWEGGVHGTFRVGEAHFCTKRYRVEPRQQRRADLSSREGGSGPVVCDGFVDVSWGHAGRQRHASEGHGGRLPTAVQEGGWGCGITPNGQWHWFSGRCCVDCLFVCDRRLTVVSATSRADVMEDLLGSVRPLGLKNGCHRIVCDNWDI